ncbi:MAG: hypothetical protein CL424_18700 [Acidimicrobiaceae bacterium]|nr:hypothetical protein [Acidimicrobiaceae bacterium]
MSIEVPISQLPDELARREFGYLVTVGDDARAHVIALRTRVVRGADGAVVLRFETGSGRASRNVAGRPTVTVVFPPVELPHTEAGDMTLIVDGVARIADGSIDDALDVTPTWAVLHRAAPPLDPPSTSPSSSSSPS